MNPELQGQYENLKNILNDKFLSVLRREINSHIDFLKRVKALEAKIIKAKMNTEQYDKSLAIIKDYKSSLIIEVEKQFTPPEIVNYDVDFLNFNQEVTDYITLLDVDYVRKQDDARFHATNNDSALLKAKKWVKRSFYHTSKLPLKTGNTFRRVFKKPVKELKPWTHHVHLQDLTAYFFKEKLPCQLLPIIDKLNLRLSHATKVAWKIDEQIEVTCNQLVEKDDYNSELTLEVLEPLDQAIANLEEFKDELRGDLIETFENVFSKYEDAFLKVGTMELSNSKFKPVKSSKLHSELLKQYKSKREGWYHLFTVLSDDWEIDLELYFILYSGLLEYHRTLHILKHKIDNAVISKLETIASYLENIKGQIKSASDEAALKTLMEQNMKAVRGELTSKILPDTNDLILRQDLPSLVNNIESKIDKLISSVSEKRAVVKGLNYDEAIKSSSISYVSPYELIHFESWPELVKEIKAIKIKLTEQLSVIQNDISGLGQIAEFNLESAMSLFNEEDRKDQPDVIALQGIDRTIERVKAIQTSFQGFENHVESVLYEGLQQFNKRLVQFTNNENIYDIRVRIAKGKALQRSKEWREQAIYKLKNIVPTVISFTRLNYQKVNHFITTTYKRYGLTSQPESITAELADFLAETKGAIEKLPFVYQRLFKLEPLADINFFEGRAEEMLTLNTAYNNWMKGRFAATVLLGEKGSGATTLLNFYLNDLGTSSSMHRLVPKSSISSIDELLDWFSSSFEQSFKSADELITFLNQKKRVLVLEDIQKLYLKKVKGFEALKWLSEIIALTNEKVFYVCSCTKYAWSYLDKTIQLSEHFSYHISLNDMADGSVVNVIEKRHRVSGYNLQFEPTVSELNNKKFKKLSEQEQQVVLRERYFSSMNKIAKSNVSLALVYWLRSTRQISGNTIHIGSLKEIDFSFMKGLSMNKVFALANIVLHDGLTEDECVAIERSSVRKVRSTLYPLFEDGILVKNEGKYYINPLLYRHTIQLLKSKNIVH